MNIVLRKLLESTNRMYESWMSRREYTQPESVESILDISYLADGKEYHKVDVFRPKDAQQPLPVALWLHGGGLVLCDRKTNRPVCAEFARRGFLVFNVDYPVVPEKEVCGILEDVCRGMDWVAQHKEEYGGDGNGVFLLGDSAGAFLGLYALAAQKNLQIAKAAGVKPASLTVAAFGSVCGMYHTAEADETGLWLRSSFYGKDWKKHPIYPYLKPEIPAVASLLVPTVLITSGADKLRKSTLRLYRGLQEAGVPVKLLDYPRDPRLTHDFPILNPEQAESAQVLDALSLFFHKLPIDKREKM